MTLIQTVLKELSFILRNRRKDEAQLLADKRKTDKLFLDMKNIITSEVYRSGAFQIHAATRDTK